MQRDRSDVAQTITQLQRHVSSEHSVVLELLALVGSQQPSDILPLVAVKACQHHNIEG
jgi:hypothetical protein